MKTLIKIYLLVILPIGILTSCTENITKKKEKVVEMNPNVILLIGDGMGLSEVSSVFYYGSNNNVFNWFKEIGLMGTSSSKEEVTDSAASGTALACGEKTYNGAVGLSTDSTQLENLVEVLSERNYNTGLISTSSITHATPACFYAHVPLRRMQFEIAEQLVTSEVDFFAGGGTKWFMNREDGKDLMKELSDNGFIMNANVDEIEFEDGIKYGFLLAEDGMPTMLENRGEFLPEYTKLAIDYLNAADGNFFLMVEGSQIDWAGHANDSDYLIAEMLDFEKSVKIAMDYAMSSENTLVIVLADHETGGFTLSGKNGEYSEIEPTFATGGHSATLVPVFAYGPSADTFKGIYQNDDVFHKIVAATSH